MNRRDFLKNSSLMAAGSLLIDSLPVMANTTYNPSNKKLIICIVAGITQKNFKNIIPDANKNPHIPITYNGHAAGHRLALESILHGNYISEKESGKIALVESPLFQAIQSSTPHYLISSDRAFLTTEGKPSIKNKHIYIAHTDGNDSLIAQKACEIIKHEKPTLLLAHFMGADEAHARASAAQQNCQYIKKGIQDMWKTSQQIYSKDEITLVIMSDFGRNSFPNNLNDKAGLFGSDHSITDELTKQASLSIISTAPLSGTEFIKESIDIYSWVIKFLRIPHSLLAQ